MAKILNLPDGHCSLEFDFAERNAVRTVLTLLDSTVSWKYWPDSALVRVLGVELVADSDPMGLSLISSDNEGDAVLKRIANALDHRC